MISRKYFLSDKDSPDWLTYPHSFRRIVEQGLLDIRPWHVMPEDQVLLRLKGIRERYPSRDLVPFAYRQDNDDIACWERGMGSKVLVVHDFSSPGYEDEEAFGDVWDWFRAAVEDTIIWD